MGSVLIGCSVKENEDVLALVQEALGTSNVRLLFEVPEYFIVCHKEADKVNAVPAVVSSCTLCMPLLAFVAKAGPGCLSFLLVGC